MDVLTTDKLTEMNVSDVADWTKLLPMVATSSSQGAYQPGFGQISMRGVESGSNGNHSGPQPSVGIYLDEQPITTAVGAIDPHIYDIQRIEALAGPQGTLYGASSEAGTIRIITNKPDPTAFSASVTHGSEHDRSRRHGLHRPKATSTFRSHRRSRFASSAYEPAGRGLYRQRVRHARLYRNESHRWFHVAADHGQQRQRGAQELQLRRYTRRTRGAENRPQRQLVDHADASSARRRTSTASTRSIRASAIWKSRIGFRKTPKTAGCNRHSPCRARSATSTSSIPART